MTAHGLQQQRTGGLMHLSDLHFGCEDPVALKALERLVLLLKPEVVVVTGDLTQRATREQFGAARRFLHRLHVAHLLVQPGNHDIPLWAFWERWMAPYRRFGEFFGDRPTVLNLPWMRLVMANTVSPWRQAEGVLTREEIDRVAGQLARACPNQLRVVALHHPPTGGEAFLPGGKHAVQAWLAEGMHLLLSGHGHTPGLKPLLDGRSALNHSAWSLRGGTSVSRRLRNGMPPSLNTVSASGPGGSWMWQRWDLVVEQGLFLPHSLQSLELVACEAGKLSAAFAQLPSRAVNGSGGAHIRMKGSLCQTLPTPGRLTSA